MEWALAPYHVPHSLKLTWIYELPIGPGKPIDVRGVLGQIVGGWTLSGIHRYRSGDNLIVFDSRLNGVGYPIRVDDVPGVDKIIYQGGSADVRNGTPYLSPQAFATPPLSTRGIPARVGTAPAVLTDARGPGFFREDLGIMKRVSFGSRSLEVRADVINLLNRAGVGNPRTDLADPNFGRIFGPRYGARQLQLSVRGTF